MMELGFGCRIIVGELIRSIMVDGFILQKAGPGSQRGSGALPGLVGGTVESIAVGRPWRLLTRKSRHRWLPL